MINRRDRKIRVEQVKNWNLLLIVNYRSINIKPNFFSQIEAVHQAAILEPYFAIFLLLSSSNSTCEIMDQHKTIVAILLLLLLRLKTYMEMQNPCFMCPFIM